jgi:hypothetical protein
LSTRRRSRVLLATLTVGAILSGCIGGDPSRSVAANERDQSGVNGTVTMVQLGDHRTRVEIQVTQPAGADMPAHIHLGVCGGDVTPQPKYPLTNVRGGRSVTEVPVAVTELETISHVVNIHQSNDRLDVVVACAQLSWTGATSGGEASGSTAPPASQPGHTMHMAPSPSSAFTAATPVPSSTFP